MAIEIGQFIYIGARQKSRVLRARGVSLISNDLISVILIRSSEMRFSLGTSLFAFLLFRLPKKVRSGKISRTFSKLHTDGTGSEQGRFLEIRR